MSGIQEIRIGCRRFAQIRSASRHIGIEKESRRKNPPRNDWREKCQHIEKIFLSMQLLK